MYDWIWLLVKDSLKAINYWAYPIFGSENTKIGIRSTDILFQEVNKFFTSFNMCIMGWLNFEAPRGAPDLTYNCWVN